MHATLAREASQGRLQECERDAHRQLPNGNLQVVNVKEDVISAGTMFREDVRSALPYIETVTQKKYRYEGVMIDEEMVFGLEVHPLLWLPRVVILC